MEKENKPVTGPVNGKQEEGASRQLGDPELEKTSGGSEEKKRTMYNFVCRACGMISFGEDGPVTACAFCGSKDGKMNFITG